MPKLEEFNQLKRDLEALFSSKEMIERQIRDKASEIYKLNSECISLSSNNDYQKHEFDALCLEICNYITNVLQKKLNNDGSIFHAHIRPEKIDETGFEENKTIRNKIQVFDGELRKDKGSVIHANNYAFKNVYKLDDFMNTTSWLWNKELKSKIVEAASNKDCGFQSTVQSPKIGGDFSSITLNHSRMQCTALPKLVCKTVKVKENNLEKIGYTNPLKSYIERAFKPE
ncbi:hypothetical protein OJ253_1340 [Cryptosporidium canis]|uniref:Uncharacterized protein n=1 Tax=Cryptosporidium canis TaxID=195482 RepID=A0A9D5HVC0_9CRYT|nr:hypothetical protein OJ253_1340 [Cryptosporidium canis]